MFTQRAPRLGGARLLRVITLGLLARNNPPQLFTFRFITSILSPAYLLTLAVNPLKLQLAQVLQLCSSFMAATQVEMKRVERK